MILVRDFFIDLKVCMKCSFKSKSAGREAMVVNSLVTLDGSGILVQLSGVIRAFDLVVIPALV